MRFSKPAWVTHQDSVDQKRVPLYSCHVHPDGSRLATGGLDAKIRIWSTLPILRPDMENLPKSLCTLSMHAGPVLSVRWTHSGKWLASGSDDAIVMIWDLDPRGGGTVWGSDEANVEGWKALKRLPGHESDVTDLGWSPGDRFLASVGLDSKCIIWCGNSLEMLRKLDQHQGFVKGVCWDPVGQFFATQSDDKSVKIWRTTDWGLEATVTKPFQDSPGSTFFRRLSWSPDGAHITASNAMNNNGYIFIAAVIARGEWTSDISLVGHENTVEVASYNPHIFLRDPIGDLESTNICSVVALGADDLSISIWQTKSPRPLIVAKDAFERQIFDLSWSNDGMTLYGCSSDGTVGVFDFDSSELEGIATLEAKETYLKRFGFHLPAATPQSAPVAVPAPQLTQPIPPPAPAQTAQMQIDDNRPQIDAKGRRRIKPMFISHLSSTPMLGSFGQSAAPPPFTSQQPSQATSGSVHPAFHNLPTATTAFQHSNNNSGFASTSLFESAASASRSRSNAGDLASSMFHTPPPEFPHRDRTASLPYVNGFADDEADGNWDGNDRTGKAAGKRKANEMDIDDAPMAGGSKPPKARTLGGDKAREASGPVRELRSGVHGGNMDTGDGTWSRRAAPLPIPSLKSLLTIKMEEKDGDVFEAQNWESEKPSEISYSSGKQVQFLDYPASPVLLITVTSFFCAAALDDGCINVYSLTGRRLMPTLALDSPCAFLESSKHYLMAITSSGRLHIWNIKSGKAAFPAVPLESILTSNTQITSAQLRPNGSPIIILSTGIAYSWNIDLCSLVKINELRWSLGSDQWEGKQRSNKASTSKGVIANLETTLTEMQTSDIIALDDASERPTWWDVAYTLGHLETRMHAARVLDSPAEYKSSLAHYARKIAEEGYRAKAEELIKELCGPLYWKPGREETWCPTVLGFQKRDLLRDVLATFAKSRTLAKLGQDWQDTLRKVSAEI